MTKKSGNVLIFLGLVLFGYFIYEQIYSQILERKIIAETVEISHSLQEHVSQARPKQTNTQTEIDGTITYPIDLSIPSIKLETKILEGTSREKLRIAVGHLEGSGILGKRDENFVILGHRSHTTGKFFNRLDELNIGDQIILKSQTEYHYQVIDKKIIRPDQLEVLEPIKNKSIVTLITCHPKYSSKQRLVVITEKIE